MKYKSNVINRITCMGFNVFNDDLGKIKVDRCRHATLNTISPNSYGISTKNTDFHDALVKSEFLVLDGVYFGLASILLKGKTIQSNQGPKVFKYFMKEINSTGGRVFFLGASKETINRIKEKISFQYP